MLCMLHSRATVYSVNSARLCYPSAVPLNLSQNGSDLQASRTAAGGVDIMKVAELSVLKLSVFRPCGDVPDPPL